MSKLDRGQKGDRGVNGGGAAPTPPPPTPAPEGAGGTAAQPRLALVAQYIKDLSFENPGAPSSLAREGPSPEVGVNVDVRAQGMGGDNYEITLKLHATAKRGDKPAFVAEVEYCGLFTLQNVPREHLEVVCLVECPRILFPFARRVMSDITRDGGYPPLLLDMIDFIELYRRTKQQLADGTAKPSGEPPIA
jgi:preprotein translocase subunit SecB